MLKKFRLFLLLLFLSSATVGSPYYFNHFQVNNGLSNNAVLCSVQDKNGFIWFGTRDGLNRFDGYHFKNFIHEPGNAKSIESNLIHTLMVRNTNEIWVGTDQGIYIYYPQHEEFSAFDKMNGREILQIDEDKKGDVWFISDNKLYKYHPSIKQIDYQYADRYQQNTYAFCIDHSNEVWIGLDQGICHINSGKQYNFAKGYQDIGRIEELFVDASNNIWIGTSKSGVYKWNRNTQELSHVIKTNSKHPLYVRDIQQVKQNELWIGTESGLFIYDLISQVTTHIVHEKDDPWGLSDNAIYSILKDNQDGIWIGTFFGGINYYHPQHNLFEKIFPRNSPNSIGGHAVREIVEDRYQNLWIGTEDQGLTCWNPKTKSFTNFGLKSGLVHNNIHGLLITGDSLLVGTFYQGLNIIDIPTKKIIKHYDNTNTNGALGNNFVYHIYRTSDGKILLATAPGIYQFVPGKDDFIPFTQVPSQIFYTSMYEDDQQNLWFTTWREGVYKINLQENTSEVFLHDPEDESSLSSNRVTRVFQDSKGKIWIATEGGLCIYNEQNNSFKRFTIKDGLPSNLILAMQEDDSGHLWVSTTKGLVKMGISSYNIETYTLEHGLLDLQFNYNSIFKDSKGLFYFGAFKGLIRFNPLALSNQQYQTDLNTPIYITRLHVNQQELTVGNKNRRLSQSILYTDKITLRHDESTVSLDFVALNFASAKSTSYLYRLVGLDTTWIFLRENSSANFTKLPPGKYTFEVMAANASKTPISKIKSLDIVILPPYWASLPAYFVYGLLIVVLIALSIFQYDKIIKEQNRRRLEKIKVHKEKEVYKAKMDFFMQITHEIKTPLTLIKAPLEKVMEGDEPQKMEKWLKTIHQYTENLLTLTDNLLDFRRVESNQFSLKLRLQDVNSLILICLQDFTPLIESKQIKLTKSLNEKVFAHIDIEAIYKILSNLISNAVKYAEKEVYIDLYKIAERNYFCIEVKNDGILLSDQEMSQIFEPFQRASAHYRIKGSGLGLALASSFALLHGGTLRYRKNQENLNIFVLEIPI